jgi:predicted amidohydrolase YtcJ
MIMKSKSIYYVASLLCFCAQILPCAAAGEKMKADLILSSGAIYTMDASRRWAEAVAVADGKIVYVGSNEGVKDYQDWHSKVIELNGKMVLPSFQDCHVHPVTGGIERLELDLSAFSTRAAILKAIEKYVSENSRKEWIIGGGWKLPVFPNANPNKADLDKIVKDKPVYLESEDGHSCWVNSSALKLAGLTKDSVNPPHGRIEKDSKSGEPTGTLRESACELVGRHVPKPSLEKRLAALKSVQSTLNRLGITAVQDACVSRRELETYQQLDRQGELTLKVVACLLVDPSKGEKQVVDLVKLRSEATTKNVRASSAKMFADGVIEAHTAAMLHPYVGGHGQSGTLNFEPDNFALLTKALDKEGFQIHIHAIGDRAVKVALDSLELASNANGRRDSRHEIAHLQVIDPADRQRFRKLNVIANFQPFWMQSDEYMMRLTEPVLGPARARLQYPFASIYRTGAMIVCGSDWPVTSLNPLDAIEVAITHRNPGDTKSSSWNSAEKVDLPVVLAAYTINAAYANRLERETGSIEVGKSADLTVLDRNLFSILPKQIHTTKVLLTLFAGKEVYRDGMLAN